MGRIEFKKEYRIGCFLFLKCHKKPSVAILISMSVFGAPSDLESLTTPSLVLHSMIPDKIIGIKYFAYFSVTIGKVLLL